MEIKLDCKKVDEDQLTELIIALEHITGCRVEVSEVFVLQVNDPEVAAILQTVFSGDHQQPESPKDQPKKKGKIQRAQRPRSDVRYEVLNGPYQGKHLMGTGLSKMLKAHTIPPGTNLHHPEKGDFLVMENYLLSKFPKPVDPTLVIEEMRS
jgi:hypothetical protein